MIRYGAVGAGVTLLYSTLTFAFVISRVVPDPTIASAMATIITQPFAFFAHRAFTYPDVASRREHWKRFGIVAAASFVIAVAVMKVVDLLGWPFWIGLAIGWVVIPIANYAIGVVWIFRAKGLLALSKRAQ